MTGATQAIPAGTDSATDVDLERRVLQFAYEFEALGFVVTRQLEVEARGAAYFLGVKTETLKQWRCYGVGRHGALGPPSRSGAGLAWYPIAELLEWAERREADRRPVDAPDP